MPHHHAQHVCNVGPILFACHATCYRTCSDVMRTSCGAGTQASWPPYVYMASQKLLMDVTFAPAKLYLSKLTTSHFDTLNMRIANQNENKADCNENFRICAEEPVAPLYKR